MADDRDDPVLARSRAVLIGPLEKVSIAIAEYDADWPERFARERATIAAALGDAAIAIEHVGSTSVPGLAAKPVVDICLVVADSSDEATYVPVLERAGYELRVREPDWYEHRMLRTPGHDVHLHVFTVGCPEIDRLVGFRDRLRADPEARARYEKTKRALAAEDWPTMQHYADAKTTVIDEIMGERAPG